MQNKILRIVGLLIALIALGLVCYRLITSWNELRPYLVYINWLYVIASVIILGISYALGFYCWKFLLAKLGVQLSFSKVSAIIAVSQIGKYIPGKVWYALGRIYLTRKLNLPSDIIAISVFIEGGVLFLGGLLVASGALVIAKVSYPLIYLLPLSIIAFILIQPPVINFFLSMFSKVFKKKIRKISLTFGNLLQILLLYIVMWIVHSVGFLVLSLSIYSVSLNNAVQVMGSFITAWLLGFASIIIPGGLGIREGTLSLLLANIYHPPLNYLVAIIGRLWTTAGEAVLFVIFLPVVKKLISNYSNKQSSSQ